MLLATQPKDIFHFLHHFLITESLPNRLRGFEHFGLSDRPNAAAEELPRTISSRLLSPDCVNSVSLLFQHIWAPFGYSSSTVIRLPDELVASD